MKKFLLIVLLLISSLFSKEFFYYSNGQKHYLNAKSSRFEVKSFIPKSAKHIKALYFKNANNDFLGVSDRILIGFKDKKLKDILIKKYKLKFVEYLGDGIYVFKVDNAYKTLDIANAIYENENVQFSHPDFIKVRKKRSITPTDPLFKYEWHLHNKGRDVEGVLYKRGADIDVEKAWGITKGEGAKIGIIDDAIDIHHEDLKDNIAGYKNYSDYTTDDPSPTAEAGDYNGDWHGTSCAGLIVAAENGKGVVGVAPKAKLYAVKDGPRISDTIKALNWLNSQGVSVISNSWGTYTLDDALNRTFKNLYYKGRGGKGILIIFASGNDGYNLDSPYYQDESESPYVLSVGASSEIDEVTSYSNYGKSLDLVAPGSEHGTIVTTDVTGARGYSRYDYTFDFAGTSAAAPIVAGVAGLVFSANPNLTAKEAMEVLERSADKIGNLEYIDGRNDHYGYGRVNAYKAVLEAKNLNKTNPPNFDEPQKLYIWNLYKYLFQRDYDEEGFNYWVNEIKNGKSAAYVAKYFFLNSEEIQKSGISNEEFIKKIYKALLNRDVDEEGLGYWLDQLERKRVPRVQLLNYIIFSDEFQKLCKEKYKITPFTREDEIEAFVERFYSYVLQRDIDGEGKAYWVKELEEKRKRASDIAMDFFNSKEFLQKKISDDDFVNIAYRTLLNREPEKEGRAFWRDKLKEDISREELIKNFINSKEFENIAKKYNIDK